MISDLPESEEDKIKRIKEELAKKSLPSIIVTPEGEFGTPDKHKTMDEVKDICANFAGSTSVVIGVYISPPTPPTNSAITCQDGKVAGRDDKKSLGEGETEKDIRIKPNDPYTHYPWGEIRICANIYNENLPAPKGPTLVVIADYAGTDLAEVVRNMQLASCKEHGGTMSPTVIISNSNATSGSGTYPAIPCP